MDRDVQRTETAFAKAVNYLNYDQTAKWLAHLAAVGTGVALVGVLCILWLFVDLMVWRGRVPALRELSPRQHAWFEGRWESADREQRTTLLQRGGYPAAEAARLAALPFAELPAADREALWEERVYLILFDRVGPDAVERVFLPVEGTRSGFVLDAGNHGVLSLVVREVAADRLWTPIPWLASWNRWMWGSPPDAPTLLPTYLAGLAILAVVLGLAWAFLVILNREMAARATIEASNRLRRAVYHHTFRLGTLAVRALGPSEAVSILTRHVEAVHDALYIYLTVYYREAITFVLLVLFAFLVQPLLALAFLLSAVVVWQVGMRLVAALGRQADQATGVAAERLTIIRESLMLMRLVKCYHMEQFNQAHRAATGPLRQRTARAVPRRVAGLAVAGHARRAVRPGAALCRRADDSLRGA